MVTILCYLILLCSLEESNGHLRSRNGQNLDGYFSYAFIWYLELLINPNDITQSVAKSQAKHFNLQLLLDSC